MKHCAVCGHAGRELVDRLLTAEVSPRSITRRVGDVSRLELTQHRDECIADVIAYEEKENYGDE